MPCGDMQGDTCNMLSIPHMQYEYLMQLSATYVYASVLLLCDQNSRYPRLRWPTSGTIENMLEVL